jgi:predicted esterase
VWVFHGDRDGIVQLEEAQEMADAVTSAGGEVKFTSMPGKHHHDLLQEVYENEELYRWFLKCCS